MLNPKTQAEYNEYGNTTLPAPVNSGSRRE